ncbi:MAG: Rrf2 family transcriptional regulator [Spirochaetota bacterium]
MRLSTRSRYGMRLMYELALHYGEGTVFLKQIAKRQAISEKYLSKLVIPLKGAGLINSSRGAHGGYTLAKSPREITAKDIIKVLEGDIAPVECVKNRTICSRSDVCPTLSIWEGLEKIISEYLLGITLENMVTVYKEQSSNFQI